MDVGLSVEGRDNMGYKNLMISKPAKLSIRNQQLVVEGEDVWTYPLEDMDTILVESGQVVLTSYCVQMAAENGVLIYFCDNKHLPNSVLLPMVSHSRHFRLLKMQIGVKVTLQKRLWSAIVKQKISNQGTCMRLAGRSGAQEVEGLAKCVMAGDKTNVEAQAAIIYFPRLFYHGFTRDDPNLINAALNYGYAILRGVIARSIVVYGMEPSIGLWHHSELNRYNLADDLIEPFRQVVDLYVVSFCEEWEEGDLTVSIKRGLYQLLNTNVRIDGEVYSVSRAVDKMVVSLSGCLQGRREELSLPELLPFKQHCYE